jgi:hypothetical protein
MFGRVLRVLLPVERFVAASHYEMLAGWWRGHGQEPPPLEVLPKVGFVVPGYAAGFFYRTDSTVAIVEWLLANPDAETTQRSEALDRVCAAIIEEARALGFKLLTATMTSAAVIRRAQAHGLSVLPGNYTALCRTL